VIPENVEWCNYAEIYDPPEARAEAAMLAITEFTDTRLEGKVDPATAGLTVIDSTGSGQTDLLVWSSQGIRCSSRGASLPPNGPGRIDRRHRRSSGRL